MGKASLRSIYRLKSRQIGGNRYSYVCKKINNYLRKKDQTPEWSVVDSYYGDLLVEGKNLIKKICEFLEEKPDFKQIDGYSKFNFFILVRDYEIVKQKEEEKKREEDKKNVPQGGCGGCCQLI